MKNLILTITGIFIICLMTAFSLWCIFTTYEFTEGARFILFLLTGGHYGVGAFITFKGIEGLSKEKK